MSGTQTPDGSLSLAKYDVFREIRRRRDTPDLDQLAAYWTSDPVKAWLAQMRHDLPQFYSACAEHKDRRKTELQQKDAV